MRYLFTLFFLSSSLFAQETSKRPALVVGIVIDQMRQEYLYRFEKRFSSEGFKRLMKKGYTFHNAHYDYVPTYTAVGHSSIYTGADPSSHGILANDWYDPLERKEIYCTEDNSVHTIGEGSKKEGAHSPRNLLTTTVADELKMFTDFKSKVISISLKDRAAILPAGHFADGAYWLSKSGNFISSSFYMNHLPIWVKAFNDQQRPLRYLSQQWKPVFGIDESYSSQDTSVYKESPYQKGFPYDLSEYLKKDGPQAIKYTPFGNDLIADFAEMAVENEKLGQRNTTDFLAISFSATDYIGHKTGPRSAELEDTYIRMDLTLARLLKFLDKKVGSSKYLLFLTADHAVAENPLFMKDHKYEVDHFSESKLCETIKAFSKKTYDKDLIENCSNLQIFTHKDPSLPSAEKAEVFEVFKNFIRYQKGVKTVYTQKDLQAISPADRYGEMISRAIDPQRSGDLMILLKPGILCSENLKGSTHGSPYAYDTHVPLIWYGLGIPKGNTHEKVSISQIAPTLSQKLQITFPNASSAKALKILFP